MLEHEIFQKVVSYNKQRSELFNSMTALDYVRYIMTVEDHKIPVRDIESFNKWNKVLSGTIDFVLFDNDCIDLYTLDTFKGNYSYFLNFLLKYRKYIYCYQYKHISKLKKIYWDLGLTHKEEQIYNELLGNKVIYKHKNKLLC
jgi:hypothetical protein